MFAVTLGWIAALLAAVVAVPQVVRLVRTGSTAGISVLAWRLNLCGNVAWTLHGVFVGHLNVVIPNAVFGVLTSVVLVLLARDRRLSLPVLFLPSLAAGLLTAGVDVWFGPVWFAVAAGLPSFLAWAMQLQELMIAPRITAVSVPYLALNVVNQVLWGSWSLLVGETSVTICATGLGVLMLLNLGWALMRRHGFVRARLAQMWA